MAVLNAALRLHARYKFSYWDCAVISAARELGCTRLLTEDLTHGQKIVGLTVVNPFKQS
jgi:predicted nucleic acid-binding protein